MFILSGNGLASPAYKAALFYVSRGHSVVPVLPNSKQPSVSWQLYQSQLPTKEVLEGWERQFWAKGHNLALVCGRVSGIVVLDIDDPEKFNQALSSIGEEIPDTPIVETPRGCHIYFAYPDDCTITRYSRLTDWGAELRGEGHYVVAPPSVFDGHCYAWAKCNGQTKELGKVSLAPCPEWVLQAFGVSEKINPTNTLQRTSARERKLTEEELLFLVDLVTPFWKEGNRHDLALSLAGAMAKAGWSKEDVKGLLHHIVAQAADNEQADRIRAVRDTYVKIQKGENVIAWQGLREILGEEVTDSLRRLIRSHSPKQISGNGDLTSEAIKAMWNALPTDANHGRIVAEALRDCVKFVSGWGWVLWNGKVWQVVQDESIVETKTALALSQHYIDRILSTSDPKERQSLFEWGAKSQSRAKISAAVALSKGYDENGQALLRAEPDDFDTHPELINTPNGVVDLKTGELLPHDPKLMITKMTRTPYNPNADCPQWRRFLSEIFAGNEQVVAYLQRLLGYCLLGDNRERIFVIFCGSGSNGKTVLCDVVSYVLGDYAVEAAPETFMTHHRDMYRPRNDLARLVGSRLVFAAEAKDDWQLDGALIKRLTGCDPITVRFLFKEHFTYRPQWTPILRTNQKPRVRGDDQALWDRLRLVPFSVRIPPERQNKRLAEVLKAEAEGILRWLIEGCVAYHREGLCDPYEVLEATARYRAEVDDIWRFMTERTEQVKGEKLPASELYGAYERWCEGEGVQPVTKTRFGKYLANIGYVREKIGRVFYLDLRLRDDHAPVSIPKNSQSSDANPDTVGECGQFGQLDSFSEKFPDNPIERTKFAENCPNCPTVQPNDLPKDFVYDNDELGDAYFDNLTDDQLIARCKGGDEKLENDHY